MPSSESSKPSAQGTQGKGKLKAELNTLAGEIGDALKENAEEFVKSDIQRGGE